MVKVTYIDQEASKQPTSHSHMSRFHAQAKLLRVSGDWVGQFNKSLSREECLDQSLGMKGALGLSPRGAPHSH